MLKELEEKGREDRARIVQELFKLYERRRELEKEIEGEITELLKSIDADDSIESGALKDDGLEYWTKKGKVIYVGKEGSIAVRSRNGTYIIGQRVVLL